MSKRTLERFFRQYVGVVPKWVIQHYRLHEAAEYAATDHRRDWPDLAAALATRIKPTSFATSNDSSASRRPATRRMRERQ